MTNVHTKDLRINFFPIAMVEFLSDSDSPCRRKGESSTPHLTNTGSRRLPVHEYGESTTLGSPIQIVFFKKSEDDSPAIRGVGDFPYL